MNYYWFDRQEILQKAKEKYSKEKVAEYYLKNKEATKEKSRECQKNLSQEEKDKFKEYQKNKQTNKQTNKQKKVKNWFSIESVSEALKNK